jgi:hypothetical protein
VPQSQPGKYSGEDDEDRYEASVCNLLRLGELLSFSINVADIPDVSGGGVAGKTEVRIEGRKSDKAALLLSERRPRPVETPVNVEGNEVNSRWNVG